MDLVPGQLRVTLCVWVTRFSFVGRDVGTILITELRSKDRCIDLFVDNFYRT